ncbi:hypothetical protein K9U39_14240 [Rhodoblastus acidophilus]|uniref:Phasin protein n=1 Tax=Candidatus Rhodoblastus alkanivorans TaxID=2954117 RepID=A0ABS9ZBQ9_9HYPH|nr:hypothetical protein [Candidatus Rhodoblastus alkanivorans]MCI4677737.1 hypothetical protein [Candidatus Rhodoblastus alkanivorans]MCI4684765.1 hypothetical protein [Candidatus Rhodoblastus alkanivorans]MDI4642088.1 hypothetical protein [Rhodoblastus acidophilus]
MKNLFTLQKRLMRTSFELVEIQTAALTTISARLPMIAAAASGFATEQQRQETHDMVAEKLQAASEGIGLGALQTAKATMKVMTGDADPLAMAGHMMDVAAAATRPARKKVRANARRLARAH